MKYLSKKFTLNFQLKQICHRFYPTDLIQLTLWTLFLTTLLNVNDSGVLAQPLIYKIQTFSERPLVNKLVHKLDDKKVNKNLKKRLSQCNKKKYHFDDRFTISPHTVNNREINPFTTTIILNGTTINHLTNWQINPGYEFGSNFSNNFVFNSLIKLNGKIEESLTKDNIYTIEQTGKYLQIQTVKQLREVTVEQKQPQTMNGMEMQMSLIASCLFPGSSSKDLCTYTPGLVTDRNSINQDFFVPSRIVQTSKVGDVVKPDTLAAIVQPGFQRGTKDQQLGVDLYFPNVGTFTNDIQANKTSITRTETIDYKPGVTFSSVRQIIKANDQEAAIGLTIRGWTGILDDKNTLLNSAIQLSTELLPDAVPHIDGSARQPNKNININLLLAARNTRVPVNSFTIYQAGIGKASSPQPLIKRHSQAPTAKFNSVWIGLSPITERHYRSYVHYVPTGSQRIITDTGAEGGPTKNVSFVSAVNNEIFSTPNLDNFYTQIYLKFFDQDVNLTTTTTLKEKLSYYPHISFSGNFTGTRDVLRYYTGVIFAEQLKPYVGLDYTRNAQHGWNYQVGAIGYINPDHDYYSHLLGNLSKTIILSKTTHLVLSTGFDYIFDGDNRIDHTLTISPESSVTFGAVANIGSVSLGLTNFFGGILPKSFDNTLLTSLVIHFSQNLHFSAYFSPINENPSRSRYGASLQWQLSKYKLIPSLALGWSRNEYDFGKAHSGRDLGTNNDVFTIQLQIGL